MKSLLPSLRRGRRAFSTLAATAALSLLATPASATWSIVVVDSATGEVCVAAATCLQGFDLLAGLPVLQVGRGAAAAQSLIDQTGNNRLTIWQGFLDGDTPDEILTALEQGDSNHDDRQYGIVDLLNQPTKFTGNKAGPAKASVQGIDGTLRYAVQGNVLTAKLVVFRARKILLETEGDLATRVMAAMEEARSIGGDGRCSCDVLAPESCGAPPPGNNWTSSSIAFIAIARIGDTDGVCNPNDGCANGDYYLKLNVAPGTLAEDGVVLLQDQYAAWRAGLAGRPDHLLSRVKTSADSLPADGQTRANVRVELVDVEGVPLTSGGATITVTTESGLTNVGPVTDHGDGSYSFDVAAGTNTGTERLVIVADDGVARATLYPYPELELDPPAPLHVGRATLSSAAGGSAPFTLDLGAQNAGVPYLLLASGSGTFPGKLMGSGVVLPLNPDPLTVFTARHPGPPALPGSVGVLDANGRAQAALVARPGLLDDLVGLHVDWAVLTGAPGVAGPVGLDVEP